MKTIQRNIVINEGSNYYQDIWFKDSDNLPIDMSTYTARMQVRADYTENAELIFDADTTNGMLEFHADGDAGKLTVSIPSTATTGTVLNGAVRQAVYDIEIISALGAVTQIYRGHCDIRQNITV